MLVKLHVSPLQLELNAATGGWFVVPLAGFSARSLASQVAGELNPPHVHCGSVVPAADATM